MTLYVKPGMDGRSVGDCPFAHFVRMVLAEKGLEYDLVPSPPEGKPRWLVDDYSGKMPALRHRRECYVDSDVIAQYLDFFFPVPDLSPSGPGAGPKKSGGPGPSPDDVERASAAAGGLFPAMARYVKHRPSGDGEDDVRRAALESRLRELEVCLSDDDEGGRRTRTGPYLVGDGERFTLLDCSTAPKLYAMDVCLRELKGGSIDVSGSYPRLRGYMDALFERPSFRSTAEYGPETIVWGWTSHLN
jgi:glutathione S-transferase